MMQSAFGLTAFTLTLLIQFPQLIKVLRTRHTNDLSWGTYVLVLTASLSWFAYGVMRGDLPVWTSNLVGALLAGVIMVLKLKYDTHETK